MVEDLHPAGPSGPQRAKFFGAWDRGVYNCKSPAIVIYIAKDDVHPIRNRKKLDGAAPRGDSRLSPLGALERSEIAECHKYDERETAP